LKLEICQFDSDFAYILPIGDIHFGDRAFKGTGIDKLKENLEWAVDHQKHTAIVLMGDIFNIAGRDTKTSPFESDPEEIIEAQEFFKPYAHLIKAAIQGNHEHRLVNSYGIDPLRVMCHNLSIPYMGTSGILRVQVGKRPDGNAFYNTYHLALHHSRGGGGSLGNAINAAVKLGSIYEGCDAYLIGHNHTPGVAARTVYYPAYTGIKERKIYYVSCGSYLSYKDSYAETGMYAPSKLGSPRIRLDGRRDKHDLHVSV
jgi:hypothetical protein